MPMCGLLRSPFRHSLHLIGFAVKFADGTLDKKQCIEFRRLVAGSDQTESMSLWLIVSVSPL